jgi:hypothetical protein
VGCAQRLLGRPSREGDPLTRRRHEAICERVMGTLPIPVTSVSSDAIVFFTPTSFRSFAACSRYERFRSALGVRLALRFGDREIFLATKGERKTISTSFLPGKNGLTVTTRRTIGNSACSEHGCAR